MDPPSRVRSDADAVRDSLHDASAFAALFDRHYDAIWRYLSRRAGAGVADELGGETFLRAFAARRRYDLGQPDAAPWLYGIATNLLRRHARTEARRRRAYARAAEPDRGDEALERVEARVDASAARAAVAAAVEHLQRNDRDTLLLFALTDLDYAGIAIATGVPVGTVRSRLHRARRRVRIELGVDPDAPDEDTGKEGSRS